MLNRLLGRLDSIASSDPRHIDDYELEARFGLHKWIKGGKLVFESTVKRAVWSTFMETLDDIKLPQKLQQIITYDYPNNIRQRFIDGVEHWERKVKLENGHDNFEDPDHWIRFAIATETKYQTKPVGTGAANPVPRSGQRKSYQWDAITLIDVSEFNTPQSDGSIGKNYEIEVEFINPVRNRNKLSTFMANVYQIFTLYRRTHYLYSKPDFEQLNRMVNITLGIETLKPNLNSIERRFLSQARNLKLEDLTSGRVIDRKDKVKYIVTHKTDGSRKFLVLCSLGVWLIYPPYEYNKISTVTFRNMAIFDVEVVEKRYTRTGLDYMDCQYLIEPIDFLYWSGRDNADLRKIPDLTERLMIAKEYKSKLIDGDFMKKLNDPTKGSQIDINFKELRPFNNPNEFFKAVEDIYVSVKALKYDIDGIILTPINTIYNDGFNSGPDIMKWKPLEAVSIDARVITRGDAGYHLMVTVGNDLQSRREEEFLGNKYRPFNPLTDLELGNFPIHNQNVVEFKWNPDTNKLFPFRPRNEKQAPNSMNVALDNWKDMVKPITLKDMSGKTTFFYRRYHNEIKKALLRKASGDKKGGVHLVIGAGQAGDVWKWTEFHHIIAVEPNYGDDKRLAEFFERITAVGMQDRVTLIQAGGQDYDIIIPHVMRLTGGQGVNSIDMMDSLTFFWENEEILQGLIKTIDGCLKANGVFVWKCMDGDIVYDKLVPPFEKGSSSGNLVYGPIDGDQIIIRLFPDSRKKVHITFPGFVGEQDEYLTHLAELQHLLSQIGVQMKERYQACDPTRFLSTGYLELSKLYSYGLFIRKSFLNQSYNYPVDMSRIVDPHKLRADEIGYLLTTTTPNENTVDFLDDLFSDDIDDLTVQLSDLNVTSQEGERRLINMLSYRPNHYEIMADAVNDWCDLDDRIVRLSTIGDGHCMVHSFLQAIHPDYRRGKTIMDESIVYHDRKYIKGEVINDPSLVRTLLAVRLRHDISVFLASPSVSKVSQPRGTLPFVNWETIFNCQFVSFHLSQVYESGRDIVRGDIDNLNEGKQHYNLDYSLEGLNHFINSNKYLGEEFISIIAEITGIDILIITGHIQNSKRTTNKVNYYTRSTTEQNPFCIVLQVISHYETVGILVNDKIQTVFNPSNDPDSFYQRIRAKTLSEDAPKINFYQAIINSLADFIKNRNREIEEVTDDQSYDFMRDIIFDLTCRSKDSLIDGKHQYVNDFGRNPFYHHFSSYLMSMGISNGVIKYEDDRQPQELTFEPIPNNVINNHIDMTVETIKTTPTARNEDGSLSEIIGQRILNINSDYIAYIQSGSMADRLRPNGETFFDYFKAQILDIIVQRLNKDE